jgi:dihydrofolate synthase/folylpolyglutamate synthase
MPLVENWYFTDLPTPRAAKAQDLMRQCQALSARKDVTWATFEDPMQALQAAMRSADPADRIVVFGSFYTVGGVLKQGLPKLQAQHLNVSAPPPSQT